MRQINPRLEHACGEYELSKVESRANGKPHTITVRSMEKKLGLKPHQLACYRANYLFRKQR